MAYKIQYDMGRARRFPTRSRKKIPLWMPLLLGAVVLTATFWNRIYPLLLPGDPDITASAVSAFAQDMKAGMQFHEAAAAFCKTVLEGADAP